MRNVAWGLVALPIVFAGILALLLPAQPGWPPGWVIVLVLFAIPILGMVVRQLVAGAPESGEIDDEP